MGVPHAAAAEPRRVELAVAEANEIFARVVGQTADLPVATIAVGDVWVAPDALRVSFEMPPEGPVVVVVADPTSGRTLRREVAGTAHGGLAASAQTEAVALVVRSGIVELLATAPLPETDVARAGAGDAARRRPRVNTKPENPGLAETTTVERDRAPVAPRDAPAAAEPPAEPAVARSEHERSAGAPPGAWGASLRAGVQAAFDGAVPPPQVAPEVGLGVRLGAFGLGLVGGYGLMLESRDDASLVELRRHHATLELSYALDALDAGGVAFALRGGLYALERATRVRDGNYLATADRTTTSALFGACVRLLVPLAGGVSAGHGLSLLFEAGVDVVPDAPTLAYDQGGAAVERDRLWIVEPALALGLEYIVWP